MIEYERYKVKLEFVKPVVGGLPKNPNVIDAWINSRLPPEEAPAMAEKIKDEVNASEEADKKWVGFKEDDKGIYLEDRNIKAMLREAATTLQLLSGKGSVARKQAFQHALTIEPYRIHFMRNGKTIKEPDEQQERTIHVMTRLGPRDSLKREDVINPPATMEFEMKIVIPREHKHAMLSESDLRDMLEVGQDIGLGGSRSQQFGKFKVVKFEKMA